MKNKGTTTRETSADLESLAVAGKPSPSQSATVELAEAAARAGPLALIPLDADGTHHIVDEEVALHLRAQGCLLAGDDDQQTLWIEYASREMWYFLSANNYASLVSQVPIIGKAISPSTSAITSATPTEMAGSIPLLDKLTPHERTWAQEHPNAWRTLSHTPAPEAVTSHPRHTVNFGTEAELYGRGIDDEYDEFADAVESYAPDDAGTSTVRRGALEQIADEWITEQTTPLVDVKAVAVAEMQAEMQHALAVLGTWDRTNDTDETPKPKLREITGRAAWALFLGGRSTHDRQSPLTASTRRQWREAEVARRAAEKTTAAHGPLWIPTPRVADLLGIKGNSVVQLAKRHHLAVWKVSGKNHYGLSDILWYASRFIQPHAQSAAA